MTDVLRFTAGGVQFNLTLGFATAGATSGVVKTITGTVGASAATGPDATYENPDNTITAASPYLDPNGISFDAGGQQYNFYYQDGGYEVISTVTGSKAEPATAVSLAVCFVEGTRIATESGWTPVERLAVGDLVQTAAGALRSVKWTGHRVVDCESFDDPSSVLPVRVAAHAFGPARPMRDLYLSPGHAVCIDMLGEVLTPISSLLNGATIRQDDTAKVAYWHVELESHDVLLAENLPAESYLDMANRGFFVEAGRVDLAGRPDARVVSTAHFCRPYHAEGPIVDAARAQLVTRAKALGWRIAAPGAFCMLADGKTISPDVRGGVAVFPVPRGDAWLISETSRPCDVGVNQDRRDLGVAIARMSYGAGASGPREIALDDPRLNLGFHPLEEGPLRWTGRRAFLPQALFADARRGSLLRIEMAQAALPRWVASDKPLDASQAA